MSEGGSLFDSKNGNINNLSTEILKAILVEDMNGEPSERLSPETIKRIVTLIREREEAVGQYEPIDVTTAWENFKVQQIPDDKETHNKFEAVETSAQCIKYPHRRPTLIRVSAIIVACIGILFAMVVAQAAGIDVFGAIGRWTEETFHFVSSSSGAIQKDTEAVNPSPENISEYNSIQTALKECGITEELTPTWYPDGFETSEPEIISTSLSDTINVPFLGEDDQFYSIDITLYQSVSELTSHTFEKDSAVVEQYTSGTKTFYIFSNMDTVTATWSEGLLTEKISGNLSTDQVKTIIDSIGRVIK